MHKAKRISACIVFVSKRVIHPIHIPALAFEFLSLIHEIFLLLVVAPLPPRPPFSIRNSLKFHVSAAVLYTFHTTCIKPSLQVLTLTNVKHFQLSATFNYGFNTGAGYADASTHRKVLEFEEMERYAAERGVGNGRTAESEIKVC